MPQTTLINASKMNSLDDSIRKQIMIQEGRYIKDVPLPCQHAASAFKAVEDACGYDAGESLGDEQTGVEDRDAKRKFFPCIPATHEVDSLQGDISI